MAEEVGRGFDILTNGELRGGLAKIEATNYMKQQPKAWDRISPKNMEDQATGACTAMNATPSLEFQTSQFERRSRRLNTNLAPTPV